VREVVIVISDLYLSQETPDRQLPAGIALPGLEHTARFGSRSPLAAGWRSWLAHRLGHEREIASAAPATICALALNSHASDQPLAPMVWMASPMHLIAGLTSVHLDRRSVLRLRPEDLAALELDFQRTFGDSGFALRPLDSGEFLLSGPEMPLAGTLEPARSMGESIAADVRGTGAPALRRLGAEIEMWLHDHTVNDARNSRGELPVTGLWLWGAGKSPRDRGPGSAPPDARGMTREAAAAGAPPGAPPSSGARDILFGADAYLRGLGVLTRTNVLPLPAQLTDVFGYPHAQRAVLVIEISPMLHSNPQWTFFDALMQIDRNFIAPATKALSDHTFEQLVIVANDHELALRARDRFKFWRRTPAGLAGLQ
jgi:hypothetical protein